MWGGFAWAGAAWASQPQYGAADIAGFVFGGDFTTQVAYGGDSGDQQSGYAYGGDFTTDVVFGEDGRAG